MPKKDINQITFGILQQATGEGPKVKPTPRQESSRKGGLKGGVVRASKLTPEQRSEIAQLGAQARWKKAP